jgi:hypothetical protein
MDIFERIEKFNEKRNLLGIHHKDNEVAMLKEELKEYKEAETTFNEVGELSDIVVVAIGTILKNGFDPTLVMNETLKKIESREGSLSKSGKWKKDRNQDPNTLYKPNFAECMR